MERLAHRATSWVSLNLSSDKTFQGCGPKRSELHMSHSARVLDTDHLAGAAKVATSLGWIEQAPCSRPAVMSHALAQHS